MVKNSFLLDYLQAKSVIDGRSRYGPAVGAFLNSINKNKPRLKILDLGCGAGHSFLYLLKHGLSGPVHYFGLDPDVKLLWSAGESLKTLLRLSGGLFHPAPMDADYFIEILKDSNFDAVIGHSFWDLVDIDQLLPSVLKLLTPGGSFYFSCTYDGTTRFSPPHPDDRMVENSYNASMNYSGFAATALESSLEKENVTLLESGDSVWEITPGETGYSDEERVFLRHILGMVESSLPAPGGVWMQERSRQFPAKELGLTAKHRDIAGVYHG
jgi:SAM-dependent methyltransferase